MVWWETLEAVRGSTVCLIESKMAKSTGDHPANSWRKAASSQGQEDKCIKIMEIKSRKLRIQEMICSE